MMTLFHVITIMTIVTTTIADCVSGDQDIFQLHEKLKIIQEEVNQLKQQMHRDRELFEEALLQVDHFGTGELLEDSITGGGTYVRWGRSTCSGDTELIYDGRMGGVYTGYYGSGTNFVCLPMSPQWANYIDDGQYDTPGRALIAGTEYQGDPDALFDSDNLQGLSFVNQDVPCAVCVIQNRTSVVMIPAQTDCPAGWTSEYWGYLMGQRHDQPGRSSYECVDHAPEGIPGGSPGSAAAHLFHTESMCGSLPCLQYVQGRELTCVTCSR